MDVRGETSGQGRVTGQEARLRYGDGDYVIMTGGTHVRCAVSGRPIPLTALRYWSATRQEAYYGPEEAQQRLLPPT